MTSVIMPDRVGIVGGVDTHADIHVAAAVDLSLPRFSGHIDVPPLWWSQLA
ncbi:hypothetical protein BH23ACT4_BH23ACT4_09040 [soil metagenome]